MSKIASRITWIPQTNESSFFANQPGKLFGKTRAAHEKGNSSGTLSKGLTYIGGDFTYVGPNTGYGAALSTTTGAPDLKFPRVNGSIYAVTPDGADGWYIGGRFTKVGDSTRNGLARIKADGTVESNWDPNPVGATTVYAIVVNGSTVYVGGSFTNIGGQQRRCLAALNTMTGQATSWNPNVSHAVRALAIKGGTIYVGGDFNSIGGQSRNRLGAIDIATGKPTAWNPDMGNVVFAIVVSDTLVIVGGGFGAPRPYLAAIGITSGRLAAWQPRFPGSPNFNGTVYALALKGSTLYVLLISLNSQCSIGFHFEAPGG